MNKLYRSRLLIVIAIVLVICLTIWWITKPKQPTFVRGGGPGMEYIVKIVHPEIKSMPIGLQEVGTVQATESVNIIPQVSGVLKKIYFTPGEEVQAGQLLFEIDPSVYETEVKQYQANLHRDQAQLTILKATADRYAGLAKLEYITRQQYDEAFASMQEQEAVVASDQAQLDQKQIQLQFTKIRAPISGKTGSVNPNLGDLITANSATPILIINRLDNVVVTFNIPQDRLPSLLKYQRQGTLDVEVLSEDGSTVFAKGHLVFIGNTVNSQTGTVEVKAEAKNPDLQLWPGQLVRVRLILAIEPNALVITNGSVQLGQNGDYVYLVKNHKAVIQPITISRVIGSETVIASGLKPEDEVIAEIPPGLEEGSKVKAEK